MRKDEDSGNTGDPFGLIKGGKLGTLVNNDKIAVSQPSSRGEIITEVYESSRDGVFFTQNELLLNTKTDEEKEVKIIKNYQNNKNGVNVFPDLFHFDPASLVYLPLQFNKPKTGYLRQRIIETIKKLKPMNRYYNDTIDWENYAFQVIPMDVSLIAAPFNPFGSENGPTLTKITEHPYPDTLPESQYYEYLLSYIMLTVARRYVGLSIERDTNRILDLNPARFNQDLEGYKKLFKIPKEESTLFGRQWVVDIQDDDEVQTKVFTDDFTTTVSGEHLTSKEAYLAFRKTLESEEYTQIREQVLATLKTTLGSRYNTYISLYETHLTQAQQSDEKMFNNRIVPVVIMFPRHSRRHLVPKEFQFDLFVFDHVPQLKNVLAKMGFAKSVCPYPALIRDYFQNRVFNHHPFFDNIGAFNKESYSPEGFAQKKDNPCKLVYGANTFEIMTPKKALNEKKGLYHELDNVFYRLDKDSLSAIWQQPVVIPLVDGVGLARTPLMTYYLPMLMSCHYTEGHPRHGEQMYLHESVWFGRNMKGAGGLSNSHVYCFGTVEELEGRDVTGDVDVEQTKTLIANSLSAERTGNMNNKVLINGIKRTHRHYYDFVSLNKYTALNVLKPYTLSCEEYNKNLQYELGDDDTVMFIYFSDYDFDTLNHFKVMCSQQPSTSTFTELRNSNLITSSRVEPQYDEGVDPIKPIGNEKEVAKAYYTDREKAGHDYIDPERFDGYWTYNWQDKFDKYYQGDEEYDNRWYWFTMKEVFKLNTFYKPYDNLKVEVVLLNK